MMLKHNKEVAVVTPEGYSTEIVVGVPERVRSISGRSPSEILWIKLRRNRTAMIGLYTLAVMYAATILAGYIAPYSYDNARHDLPFYPPMIARIHIFDDAGHLSRPFVYHLVPVDPQLALIEMTLRDVTLSGCLYEVTAITYCG